MFEVSVLTKKNISPQLYVIGKPTNAFFLRYHRINCMQQRKNVNNFLLFGMLFCISSCVVSFCRRNWSLIIFKILKQKRSKIKIYINITSVQEGFKSKLKTLFFSLSCKRFMFLKFFCSLNLLQN